MNGDFGLQLGDAPASCHQLRVLATGPPGQLAGVDQMLTPPDVDRLANSQIGSDLSHRTARGNQIKDLAAELRRIPLRHGTGDPLESEDRDHPASRLRPTRGTSLVSLTIRSRRGRWCDGSAPAPAPSAGGRR